VVVGVLDGSPKPLRMIGSPAIRGHRLELWIIEPRTMIDSCRHQIDCPNYASGLNELSLRLKRAPSVLLRTDPLRPFDWAQDRPFDRAQDRPAEVTGSSISRKRDCSDRCSCPQHQRRSIRGSELFFRELSLKCGQDASLLTNEACYAFRHPDPEAEIADLLPPHLHDIRNLQVESLDAVAVSHR